MQTRIEVDISEYCVMITIDHYAYGFSDMGDEIEMDMWKRYPEFENKETDDFWEEGEEYWYILG